MPNGTFYERVWQEPAYRIACYSLDLWERYRGHFPERFASALDVGCGTGRLLATFCEAGIDAWGVDFAGNCLDPEVTKVCGYRFAQQDVRVMDLDRRFDVGVCADLMEHLSEFAVIQALERVAAHCDTALFLIANYPSRYDGVDLHLTLRPLSWWRMMFRASIGEAKVLPYDRFGRKTDEVFCLRWAVS